MELAMRTPVGIYALLTLLFCLESCDSIEFSRKPLLQLDEVKEFSISSANPPITFPPIVSPPTPPIDLLPLSRTGIFYATGNVLEIGDIPIIQHGHCWGLEALPTANSPDTTQLGPLISPGPFTSRLRRLLGERDYYVRAYLVTEDRDTLYSEALPFQTPFESFLEMVRVPGGTLMHGGGVFENEKPLKEITVSSFLLGKFEVTQAFWNAVVPQNPENKPDWYHSDCYACPMESVSYTEVASFINRLNRKTKRNFRLPSEAEWEHAARGGPNSRNYEYSGGEILDKVGWYQGNAPTQAPLPVGTKKPNELGIYDMTGNIAEWCNDWYLASYYSIRDSIDPIGPNLGDPEVEDPDFGKYRVIRGGSFQTSNPVNLRISFRNYGIDNFYVSIGFRLAEDN